ncbi:MAG: glutamyl-tRNA reductase [Desulfobacterales bacterium]|nr:glutamyl-tRNA reductase [Desulfobacterales bacterium]
MLEIVLLGLNHKTAPIEIRECLAFAGDETTAALETLQAMPMIREVALVSTCNRVEVLLATSDPQAAVASVKEFLARFKKIPPEAFGDSLYLHRGAEAVRHIFRVAASLDSMMIGEPQILGQIKAAYSTATRMETTGVILNRLMHRTFFVAKRVRSETGIGDHAVSISFAAIELGRKIFGSLEGKKALLIGAGEMAELAVEHLLRYRCGQVFVANRTIANGVELAQKFNGQAIRFEEIPECLTSADIIISSTGAPNLVITRDQVKTVMRSRRNRPLFFIDIAVPRDIDPLINRLNNAYVYDIDDLKGVVEDNIEDRNREAVKAERIVDEAVIRFCQWQESLEVVPTIVALHEKLDGIAGAEIKKTLQALDHLSDEDARAIRRMTQAIINKILHDPTLMLKRGEGQATKTHYLDLTRKLFNLED